ncbi:hypothetical protein VOA_001491 [Vibrio sp. RC586]|nr:hypothetical protein VOA_001491 [Vibrio sp. RC586]
MNSPFTLVTATSNILNLSFCVERVEDAKAREKSGIKIQFRSENDIVEKFFSYELKKVDKDNARIYWLDL